MDFRFDDDENNILEQAGATFRRRLIPERLLGGESTSEDWKLVAADGWLDVGRIQDDGTAALPLPVIAGIGREAGRVLAGDAYVTNTMLMVPQHDSLPPGFLIADGRSDSAVANDDRQGTLWCFGVEPGMIGYRVSESGVVLASAPENWHFTPAGRLNLGVGTVIPANESEVGHVVIDTRSIQRTKVVHAATLVGLGERALDLAVEYATQRLQFGRAIGSFQGVKHPLADAAVALEIAWNSVLYASLRTDTVSVATAQLQAKRAVDLSTRTATQALGGIAMTWEHPAHMFLKSAMSGRYRFGTPDAHAQTVATSLIALEEAA